MSRLNGDRSRFNRVRKARMHNRTRVRAVKKALENFAYFDADLIKQVEAQGKPVHVGESSKQQVDARVIPATK